MSLTSYQAAPPRVLKNEYSEYEPIANLNFVACENKLAARGRVSNIYALATGAENSSVAQW